MSVWDFLGQFIKPGITEGGLIVIAILVTISVVSIFVAPKLFALIKELRADTAVIKTQVQNSHSTNLREEQDDRHAEIQGGINALLRAVQGIQEDVRQNRDKIDYVGERLDTHMDQATRIIRENKLTA